MSFDWSPSGPSRKITAKGQGNRGYFPTIKVPEGIVEYESCLERDFFLVCNHSPDVVKFQHQPVTITYKDKDGNPRKYTPDAYVEFEDGARGLFEIKYESEIVEKGQFYEERWAAAREWGEKRRIEFSVLTEVAIRTPRWFNVWFTLGASKCPYNSPDVTRLTALVPDNGERYDQLCHMLSENGGIEVTKAAQVICYAIYHGLVFLDTFSSRPISNGTIIRPRKRNSPSAFKPLREELLRSKLPYNKSLNDLAEKDAPPIQENLTNLISLGIPKKYEQDMETRTLVVKSWINQPRANRTAEWREKFCTKMGVCEKTVYNWVAAYREGGVEGLIPRYQRSGRQARFDRDTLEMMERARQVYLKPLSTLKSAYVELSESCKKRKVPVPPEATFRTYIYRITAAAEFAQKRGNAYLKTSFTPSLGSFQGAIAPLQVLQVDNTSFDVFPVDSECRKGLPAPNLTAAIDCHSRMITGFNLSFHPSSSRTVLEVLVQSILPKGAHATAYNTQQGWPIQGFPVLVLVDNGMDYRSKALKEFCMKYDIILEYAPVRTPRFKAFIEQWFNILHNALASENVSGFRPLLKQRLENRDLHPEAAAVLTLQELEDWVHKWVLDEYHFTNPYDDHAPAPHLRWQDFEEGQTSVILPLPREPPADKKEVNLLHLSVLERIERDLRPDGVVWAHLKYNNRELAQVFSKIGGKKVNVLLDPRDIRCVWVMHPNASTPLRVELASGWAQTFAKLHGSRPINASAWKKDMKLLRDLLKTRMTPFIYQREVSRILREELIKNAAKNTKLARKELEKVNESARKSLAAKLQSTSPSESIQLSLPNNVLNPLGQTNTDAVQHAAGREDSRLNGEGEEDHYEPKKHTYELSHIGGQR